MNISMIDLVYILVLIVVIPLYGLLDARRVRSRPNGDSSTVSGYVTIIATEWIQVALVAVWWYLAGRDFAALGLVFEPEGWRWWAGLSFALGAALTFALQSVAVVRDPKKAAAMRETYGASHLKALIPVDDRQTRWWAAVSLTAALGEEFRYRGFLIAVLALAFNPWIALVVSSTIFGLAHLYIGVGGFIKTAFNGLLLGGLFLATGSLLAPILFHLALDLSWGLMMRRIVTQPEPAS